MDEGCSGSFLLLNGLHDFKQDLESLYCVKQEAGWAMIGLCDAR